MRPARYPFLYSAVTLDAAVGRHPVSVRGQPPGWFILHARKAGYSKATVLPARPLATEPGAPVRFAFQSAEPRIRTAILLVLGEVPLPVGLVRQVILGVLGGSRTRNRRLLKPPSLPRLEYEHVEPPPGADSGRPLYESGAAAVRGGDAGEPGLEPGVFWVRARRVARLHHSPKNTRLTSTWLNHHAVPVHPARRAG
jgi:hypothetical protein